MRTMSRNRQVFWESSLETVVMAQDPDGNYVEETCVYSNPEKHEAPITPASGETTVQLFGASEIYDKVIVLHEDENFLKVGSILWVSTPIELDEDGQLAKDEKGRIKTPHNYIVVKVAETLNFINVAIKKVNVS